MIAGVVVKALIDSGATASCCSRYWYKRYHAEVGPLLQDPIHVIGVWNTPVYIDGKMDRLPLKWGRAVTSVSLLVIPTLEDLDVILGMDVLQRLGVASLVHPQETWRIPAREIRGIPSKESVCRVASECVVRTE